jgi:uncharacterized protein YjiK
MNKWSALLILFIFFSCKKENSTSLPFDFDHPSSITKLPQKLHEISGISFYKKNELACVQDEKGVIYFYDIKKDKLRKSKNISFSNDKDYEGIANVNDTLFILCSNGDISEIDASNDSSYAHTYNTFLSKHNNTEGLCFDKQSNRLLVACKGKPEKGTAKRHMKVIYGFDLVKRELVEEPIYKIEPDSVEAHFVNESQKGFWSNLFSKKKSTGIFVFDPSEVAVDPVTNDVYILSSVGKTMLCLSYDGQIKFSFHLNSEIYKQPEGIAFTSDGNMVISDEGRAGKANLITIGRLANLNR